MLVYFDVRFEKFKFQVMVNEFCFATLINCKSKMDAILSGTKYLYTQKISLDDCLKK